MKNRALSAEGFTIVELLVTIAISGIVIGSLSEIVNTYLHTSQQGRYLNLANSYVEAKVEALRNQGYNSISLGTTSLSSELPTDLPPRSTASMAVTTPYSGIKQVDLSVTYRDQGQDNTYSYSTYIGELGVGQ